MRTIWPAIYILASQRNGTLYIGVTADLVSRVSIHKQNLVEGFTQRYGVHILVHYERFDTMPDLREVKTALSSSASGVRRMARRWSRIW